MKAVRAALSGLRSAATASALAIGVPLLLYRFGGNPFRDLLQQVQWQAAEPITAAAVRPLAVTLVWLVWLLVVASVLVDFTARLRGVPVPRIRLLGPAQGIAAAVIASQAAAMLSPAAAAADTGQPQAVGDSRYVSVPVAGIAQMPTRAAVTVPQPADNTMQPSLSDPHRATVLIGSCSYTYKIVKGDSLWHIAKACLGDPERWPEIWRLNKGRYWPHVSGHTKLRDPDLILPGWVLTLPADAKVPPGAEPINPPTTEKPPVSTPTPQPQPPLPQVSPTQPPAAPSPSVPTAPTTAPGDDGVFVPPRQNPADLPSASPVVASSKLSTSAASHSTTPKVDSYDNQPLATPPDGVELPGGWITLGLGAGLLAAVAMVWRRRRQRYKPTPITTPRLQEPDLLPPLAAMTHIRSTLRRSKPESDKQAASAPPTVREYRAATVKPELPPIGPTGSQLAGAAALPLATGLGLTGDGALDAARGLLVATLAAGSDNDPDAKGRAIIPAATLATLLAVPAVELGPMPRLTVAASMAEAMTIMEEEIIRRARIIAEQEVADVAALRQTNAYAEPLPQLLLVADAPDPVWQQRLSTAIGLGETLDIGAVVLGDWPHGITLTVAADGTTTGGDGQRLAVLDTDAAAETLTMLHEAYGEQPGIAAVMPVTVVPQRSLTDDLLDPRPRPEGQLVAELSPLPPLARRPRAQVRVLGTPAVLDQAGQPVPKVRAKSVELLVYLAVNRAGAPLAQIMEALWPDATWRRASERLSTCAANLRHAIRSVLAGDEADADGSEPEHAKVEPVLNSGSHYRLDPAIIDVDWWTVLDAYALVADSSDDAAKLARLKTAIDAIGGGLADGTDYEWADTDRESVRRHHIKIYTHAAALAATEDPHQARVLLDRACEIDPLSEDLAQRAMHAAAALGDADAIRYRLRILRQALDEHGLDLGAATEQLAATLLRDLICRHRNDT